MDRSKRFTLFALPGRPVHSDTNSASPGSIIVMQQLRATTKSLTCPPLSIARYSFIQLSQQGRQWRERKCPNFDTVAKQDSNPGSLDCKSGILPLSYRAPFNKIAIQATAQMAADKEAVGLSRVLSLNLTVSCPYEIIVRSQFRKDVVVFSPDAVAKQL